MRAKTVNTNDSIQSIYGGVIIADCSVIINSNTPKGAAPKFIILTQPLNQQKLK